MKLGPRPSPRVFATRLLPVVAFTAGSLYFGNVAYLSLSVAFIQILKACPPPPHPPPGAFGGLHLDPEGVRGPPPARLCCLRQPPACPCLQRPIAFEQARRRRRLVRPAGLCACGAAAAAAVGTCQGLARSGRSVQRARGAHGMSPMPALVCRISRSQNVMRTMSTPLAAHASSVAQHPAPCPAQQPWPAGLPVRLLSLRLARSRVLLQCYPSTAEYPQASSARAR